MSHKRLYINTIGCQMNVYDAELIRRMLSPMGYIDADTVADADLVVVNTCTIREKAEQKAFSFLGRLGRLKGKNPDLIIAVGGCVAQQEGKRILKRAPYVDVVFGTQAIGRLPRIISHVQSRRCRIVDVAMDEDFGEPDLLDAPGPTDSVTRFVTIMRGCDNYCTYCVVPHVRGRETSRRPEDIVAEIRALIRSGVKEVTLLGQNVNSYGQKEGMSSFPELLAEINALEGLERIRFTTSHPKDLSEKLMTAFRDLDKLCNHVHLPVQSGSDAVLRRMNRKYTRGDYLEKVAMLREIRPDIAITTDIIVGFPGETRGDYDATLDLIRTVGYDGLFAFMYSDRPNAPAAKFKSKVPDAERRARLAALLECQEPFTLEKNRALVGSTQDVLVDGAGFHRAGDADGGVSVRQFSGRTTTNKIVNFDDPELKWGDARSLLGRRIRVRIDQAFLHSLKGSPASSDSVADKGAKCHAA